MSGTSSGTGSKPQQGWTLFPSTSTRDLPADAILPGPTPSIFVDEVAPLNLQENVRPSTLDISGSDFTIDTHETFDLDDNNTFYRPSKLRASSLERPDISAIRLEVLESRPITTFEGLYPEAFPPRLRASSGSSSIKPPPRSTSRGDHYNSSLKRDRPEKGEKRVAMNLTGGGPISPSTASESMSRSRSGSAASYQTNGTSLPALQQRSLDENDQLEPLCEEDQLNPGSFDLVAPCDNEIKQYSLETRSELLFSAEHLKVIFKDPSLFLRFTEFLGSERAASVPILLYYLDAVKALKALEYSNAVGNSLEAIHGLEFTGVTVKPTRNVDLEEKADRAFEALVREDLPAYITHVYIQTVSASIQRRITGTLPPHLREASEGLAEVFCLTDPSRPDSPIVFASEEFHRTTQYGMSYVIGRNCRFLQGPKTNQYSVKRLAKKISEGKEHCEVFLNYRRDGSPFMNLLMIAPLCDSRGAIRYFIGAQVDVSGLVKECSDLESLKRLVIQTEHAAENGEQDDGDLDSNTISKTQFQQLSEMLNMEELEIVRRRGGRMRRTTTIEEDDVGNSQKWNKGRLHINSGSPDGLFNPGPMGKISGQLGGIYENYLLVRPYPSLRILFASPTLRIPGILQSPFMNKIGGSGRIREELTRALADGRGVTAKIRWLTSRADSEGRNRWIHCTPLLGNNGAVGVWMIVVADDEDSLSSRRHKVAPIVDPSFGRSSHQVPFGHQDDNVSLGGFASRNATMDSTTARDTPSRVDVRDMAFRDTPTRARGREFINRDSPSRAGGREFINRDSPSRAGGREFNNRDSPSRAGGREYINRDPSTNGRESLRESMFDESQSGSLNTLRLD